MSGNLISLAQTAGHTARVVAPATTHSASLGAHGIVLTLGAFLFIVAIILHLIGRNGWGTFATTMGAGAALAGGVLTNLELTLGQAAMDAFSSVLSSFMK